MVRTIPSRVSAVRQVKYDAILAADLHLREDCPECRDPVEYFKAQNEKLFFINGLCKASDCPLIVAGDLFDHWKPSPALINIALEFLPPFSIVTPGQHDLEHHSLSSLSRTGLYTLQAAERARILTQGPRCHLDETRGTDSCNFSAWGLGFGQGLEELDSGVKKNEGVKAKILLWHRLTCMKDQPWKDAKAEVSHTVLRKLPGFNVVLTGDNHQQFHTMDSSSGHWLVNPGSMMRMTTAQADHRPAVYGWQCDGNHITRIELPFKEDAVKVSAKKEKKEDRDSRMESYIKRASRQVEARLSFTHNLKKHFQKNEEPKGVQRKVWEAVDE